MPSLNQDEDVHSRSHTESSDDSDSQDSDDMRKEGPGPRKAADGKVKKPANKDPNRVKRKKARRACENCQRAHLTCSKLPFLFVSLWSSFILRSFSCSTGDLRPCERCGDKKPCRDGKRKKAKYLKDTKDEDLTPTQEKEQEEQERQRAMNHYPGARYLGPGFPAPRLGPIYYGQQTGYPILPTNASQNQMGSQPYVSQSLSTAQSQPFGYSQSSRSIGNHDHNLQPKLHVTSDPRQNVFAGDPFPDIDLDQMGFDNKFGALEFNMLNELSSGLVGTPPNDSVVGLDSTDGTTSGILAADYNSSPASARHWRYSQAGSSQGAIAYDIDARDGDPFESVLKREDGQHSFTSQSFSKHGPSSYPSPSSGPSHQGMMAGFGGAPSVKDVHTNINSSYQAQEPQEVQSLRESKASAISESTIPANIPSMIPATTLQAPTSSLRRNRNPSTVYNTVTDPYSYTKAFHDLMALIRKRFSQKRTAHIAKALASIRPSFISSLMKMDDDDRVFMEKCLQRTLLEYEDNLSLTGTPTLLCRRTGEVVAVSEGFSILTGWKKAILLGREPNLNINKGRDASGLPDTSASNSRGTNTPHQPDIPFVDESRPKPVSIVDLLDDESVCDFFDDYAHLAFGDSRGSVTTPCKFLKYRTTKDKGFDKDLDSEVGSRLKEQSNADYPERASDSDDKVDCMLCWSVKRDVFDIPMLFVLNVLPCI